MADIINAPYDTIELLEGMSKIPKPKSFFLDRYFKGAPKLSKTKKIFFSEMLRKDIVMAPFVHPKVAAKPQKRSNEVAIYFEPAYIKPMHDIEPSDYIAGDNLLDLLRGNIDADALQDKDVKKILEYHKKQIYQRCEWMAANAVINASVIVDGEDYPTQIVDFNRSADNTITLSSPDEIWTNPKAKIGKQFTKWAHQVMLKSGCKPTDVIMSPECFEYFSANETILAEADRRRGVTNMPVLSPMPPSDEVDYMGKYGSFDIWVYTGSFKNQDGTVDRVLLENTITMVAPPSEDGTGGIEGVKAFAAIQHLSALIPMEVFSDINEYKNPSRWSVISESAPLMISSVPNASLKAQVF